MFWSQLVFSPNLCFFTFFSKAGLGCYNLKKQTAMFCATFSYIMNCATGMDLITPSVREQVDFPVLEVQSWRSLLWLFIHESYINDSTTFFSGCVALFGNSLFLVGYFTWVSLLKEYGFCV